MNPLSRHLLWHSVWMLALAFGLVFGAFPLAHAAPPKAEEVRVEAGSVNGELKFFPDHLDFKRGQYYKLVIHNPSQLSHYFTSDALATHVFTRKVEVLDAQGETQVEIHGAVHDMELKPGTTVAWYFYPMTNGQDLPIYCHKDDHLQHGMVGTITISGPAPFNK